MNSMKFSKLKIGDIFKWGIYTFIKIGNNNSNEPLNNQKPNCICTKNLHYCVVSKNTIVNKIKSRSDY